MEAPLRILLVLEEKPELVEAIQQELNRVFMEVELERVEIERDYFSQLDGRPSAIISDFQLLQFGALRALQLLREKGLEIPFLVIGDDVGPESAVECIKQGAADFLIKEHLNRLGQMVKRVVQETKVKREQKQTEASLREGAEHYRHLIEFCPNGIVLLNEKNVAFANRAGARLLGAASPKQLTDKPFVSFVHPDSQGAVEEGLRALSAQTGASSRLEAKFLRLNGEEINVELEAVSLIEGETQGTLIVFRDTTANKQERERIAFRAGLLSQVPDAVVAADAEGNVAYWNQSAEKLYGVSSDEALGQRREEIYKERWSGTEDENTAKSTLDSTGFWNGQLVHIKKNGDEARVDSSVSLIEDESGNRRGTISVIRDVTNQTEVEDTLKKERNFYSSVVSAASAFVVVLDKEGRIILFNRACEQATGYSTDEVRRKNPWEFLLPPEEVETAKAFFQELRSDQFPHRHEGIWITKAKDRRLISWSDTALTDDEGSVACVVSTGVDITEQKKAEEAAKGGAEYFRSLLDNTPDLLTVLDKDGIVRFESGSAEQMLGHQPDEIIGKKLLELVHPEDVDELSKVLENVKESPGDTPLTEFRLHSKEDSWRVLEGVSKNLLDNEPVSGIVFTARDITLRKKEENRIRRQLQSLETMHAIDMSITTRLDLQVTLKVIVEQVTTQLELDAACVLLFSPHAQVLHYGAGRGFRNIGIMHSDFRLGEGISGRAALEHRTIRIPDLSESADDSARVKLLKDEEFVMYCAAPLITRGELKGVLEIFSRSPFSPDPGWDSFLENVTAQAARAIDNTELVIQLRRHNSELGYAYDATLEIVSEALDQRDQVAQGHSRRVAELTLQLGQAMGMSEEDLVHARRGALLHDIGKLKIPETILLKPGPLTDGEWEIMRRHPVYAHQLLSDIPSLRQALNIPYCHHEKWDGSGYPRSLKAEGIPLAARVFSVVDVWDVLHSERPYREAWSRSKVQEHLRSLSGKEFDPQVVETFLQLEKEGNLGLPS